jgi:hypothetical protein
MTRGEDAHELRVHGVAGTPPEAMLQLGAVWIDGPEGDPGDAGPLPQPTGADQITFWRAPRRDERVRAWSWGSLTSGKWYQALYLLLLPFMIANLAGWMLAGAAPDGRESDGAPPFRTARVRWATLLVRVVGLLVTVVFVVSTQLVLADLVAWQWLYQDVRWPQWIAGIGTALTAAVLFGLVVLTRVRPKPEEFAREPGNRVLAWWRTLGRQWEHPVDPVGVGFLARRQWVLWHSAAINVALRRLHLCAGLGAIALLAAMPPGGTSAPGWRVVALALAAVTLAGVLVLLAWIGLLRGRDVPRERGLPPDAGFALPFRLVRRVLLWPAVGAVVVASVLPLWWSEPVVRGWASLPLLRGSAVWVTAAIVALAALLTAVNRGGRKAANPGAVLLIAASVGAGFGAGVISRAAGLVGGLGDFTPQVDLFVDWLAVAVTTSIALVVLAGLLRWAVAWAGTGMRTAVTELTRRASWLTLVVGVVGAAFAVVVVLRVAAGAPVSTLPRWFSLTVVLLLVVPPVAVAAVLVARRPGARVLAAFALVVGAPVVVWAVVAGRNLRVAGIDVPPPTFRDFCLAVAVVLPTAAILGRIVAGLRDRSARRGVGVLWDVGTFWPRWFHPLAPPTYSDRAVPQLEERVCAELVGRRAVLLAPHSQGTVIAGAALLLEDHVRDHSGIALLTYGSPWGRLYAEFFPTQVDPTVTQRLVARLGGRWRNLWRPSDPVGDTIAGLPGDEEIRSPLIAGHSDYWVEPEYGRAVRQLRAEIDSARSLGPSLDSESGRGVVL